LRDRPTDDANRPVALPPLARSVTDDQLLRYSRHILLDDIGIEGQSKLLASHALVIGAGGLGSPVALYLGSAGVGHITIVDDDAVDATNLQRQIAHTVAAIGSPKAHSARKSIAAINPDVRVSCITERADADLLNLLVAQADVVIDCSDNFATRHAINTACVAHRKPLVSGAAVGFDGQITVYDSRDAQSPCYACIFPADSAPPEVQCATMGVLAPLVGIIGSIQAAEALKLLTGVGKPMTGQLHMVDARNMAFDHVRIPRNLSCAVCGQPSLPA
jgi:molybdopterin-synthase adenylyltransferase